MGWTKCQKNITNIIKLHVDCYTLSLESSNSLCIPDILHHVPEIPFQHFLVGGVIEIMAVVEDDDSNLQRKSGTGYKYLKLMCGSRPPSLAKAPIRHSLLPRVSNQVIGQRRWSNVKIENHGNLNHTIEYQYMLSHQMPQCKNLFVNIGEPQS